MSDVVYLVCEHGGFVLRAYGKDAAEAANRYCEACNSKLDSVARANRPYFVQTKYLWNE